jgi:hypothetical protein
MTQGAESLIETSRSKGYVAKTLYLMMTEPTAGMESFMANLKPHLDYWVALENDGVLFAGGPFLPSAQPGDIPGAGMVIYRAGSFEEATEIAENDPMHLSGAGRFTLRPWLLNHLNAKGIQL